MPMLWVPHTTPLSGHAPLAPPRGHEVELEVRGRKGGNGTQDDTSAEKA